VPPAPAAAVQVLPLYKLGYYLVQDAGVKLVDNAG
jgi:hypothetical protein